MHINTIQRPLDLFGTWLDNNRDYKPRGVGHERLCWTVDLWQHGEIRNTPLARNIILRILSYIMIMMCVYIYMNIHTEDMCIYIYDKSVYVLYVYIYICVYILDVCTYSMYVYIYIHIYCKSYKYTFEYFWITRKPMSFIHWHHVVWALFQLFISHAEQDVEAFGPQAKSCTGRKHATNNLLGNTWLVKKNTF